MHAAAHPITALQARSFTDDDADAAEARLQVRPRRKHLPAMHNYRQAWVSSFKDEAARRDSLLQVGGARAA